MVAAASYSRLAPVFPKWAEHPTPASSLGWNTAGLGRGCRMDVASIVEEVLSEAPCSNGWYVALAQLPGLAPRARTPCMEAVVDALRQLHVASRRTHVSHGMQPAAEEELAFE